MIIRDFDISYTTSSWILTAYLISGAVSTPIVGKLSDIYGRKKMVVIILIIYIIGISAGGLSTNISFLLIARVIQGIGISNYTDTLTVDYISDGKNLNTTFWLASGFKNSSAANFNQPFRKITYGMLIDADSNTRTGYNGADYDFYVESMAGKLSAYLYQLSSTGGYRLVGSKINYTQPFMDPSVLLGSVHLQLGLGSINYPSKYNVMFYSAESFKSNEVRQFTSWVNIPPPSLQITTSPSNILIRQGEEQLIPARIKSTSGFSSDVINMTAGTNNNDTGSGFNSSELHVAVERIQPPLFKIDIPQQTPLGIYTIPLIVTIREPSAATLTKPISINAIEGKVDPEFELSKKYPTVGYLTRPLNLTITVMAPMTIGEQFRDFWGTYGQFIGLFAGGVRWSICESAV